MPRLVDEALAAIVNGDPEVSAEGIRLAISFFEHSLGQTAGLDREDVVAEPASPADIAKLRASLVDLVRAGAPDPVAGAAVFALGKLHDPGLTEFLVEVLRTYLKSNAGVLYQAMIALDNLGVDVFGGRQSMSVLAVDENRALAHDFLRRDRIRPA
jgi:HEAT repeat protein